MLKKRILAAVVLLPIGLFLIYLGGLWFAILVILFLGIAAWEYARLFHLGGYHPSDVLIVGGVILLAAERYWAGFANTHWLLTTLILISMTYHLISYEKGRDQAGTDFAITIGGMIYIGWLGSYLISLRAIQDGLWWLLLALPVVWLADSGAYFYGKRFGRHKLSPRLSPKKTWEGYIAGIVTGVIGGVALVYLLNFLGAGLFLYQGAIMGLILSVVTPLGDLGESMFKRQFGVKDSSKLIPGHGGAFDRIDSWIWAATLGYYLAVVIFI